MQNQVLTNDEQVKSMVVREGKYLTFELDDEEYGLEISKVKEIFGIMNITPIPQTPEYVKGVLNLRGKVIPVIDLRLKFNMETRKYDERTCIIVVDIIGKSDRNVIMGVIVDSVSEVMNVREEEIDDTPMFGVQLNTEFILGMAKMEGGVKILLDITKVVTTEDVAVLGNMTTQ